MQIKLSHDAMQEMAKRFPMSGDFQELIPRWGGARDKVVFDHEDLTEGDFAHLCAYSEEQRKLRPNVVDGLAQKLAIIRSLSENVDKVKVRRLDQLDEAIKQYVQKDAINYWLFSADDDGRHFPYLVTDVEYQPARKESPAYVRMSMRYHAYGEAGSDSETFHYGDMAEGRTVKDLLKERGYVKETPKLVAAHGAAVERWGDLRTRYGAQFLGSGSGLAATSRYYTRSRVYLERDGVRSKLVNDEEAREKSEVGELQATIGYLKPEPKAEGEEVARRPARPLPVHPYIYMFNLEEDGHVWVHADNAEPYVYDPSLRDKIVLPEASKHLIDVLTSSVHERMDDIIEGKTGGVIVLAKGPPGTGKTLTAEVYAEVIERPLYKVKSSQLGLDVEALEKNLQEILGRAGRWGALLLLDEADVYVRNRGDDILQNAVVGVFLRVLEYYRGLLILTTNRDTVIDDAIVSRCTAVVSYENPTQPAAVAILGILGDQFGVDMSEATLRALSKAFPGRSGRFFKNLLKLTKMYRRGTKPALEDFQHCAQFLPEGRAE